MNAAEDCRRKAQHFLMLAQHLSRPEDRSVMINFAAHWMERAEQAEREKPEKEPEGETP